MPEIKCRVEGVSPLEERLVARLAAGTELCPRRTRRAALTPLKEIGHVVGQVPLPKGRIVADILNVINERIGETLGLKEIGPKPVQVPEMHGPQTLAIELGKLAGTTCTPALLPELPAAVKPGELPAAVKLGELPAAVRPGFQLPGRASGNISPPFPRFASQFAEERKALKTDSGTLSFLWTRAVALSQLGKASSQWTPALHWTWLRISESCEKPNDEFEEEIAVVWGEIYPIWGEISQIWGEV